MINVKTNETVAAVAEQGASAAPPRATAKKATRRQKSAPKGQKGAKPKKAARTGQKARATARSQSKGARILELIGRTKGATLDEIRTATGWQAHSVRGFISTAGKRHGVQIDSSKNEAGERVYRTTQ